MLEIISPAPILNTPDFHIAIGRPHHYEFVALPGMRVAVEEIIPRHHHCIYRISTPLYSAPALFLDGRFARPSPTTPHILPSLPTREVLAARMESLLGVSYVWGGNWSSGIPELLHLYPPRSKIDAAMKTLWILKGIDCSGLLYETTNGATPRNSIDLIHFGKPIANDDRLLPMDMVVWPGHLWFVLNEQYSIESKSPFGVIRRPLQERLEETRREQRENFTIRRFIDE